MPFFAHTHFENHICDSGLIRHRSNPLQRRFWKESGEKSAVPEGSPGTVDVAVRPD
jgi:hypothetical protein